MKRLILLLIIIGLFNCKEKVEKETDRLLPSLDNTSMTLSYANGFSVRTSGNIRLIEIKNPWPKSEKTYRYALIPRDMAPKITLNADEFDGMILTPIHKIVVTSTTHIPSLELLGVEETLIGFPGTDYISSEKTRKLIADEGIRELGKNEGMNTEVLLELNPDVVVGFGVDGNNKTFETIRKSGIPVIYNGDWVEESPLAKAEWIKFFGVLYDKEKEADSIFKQIETDYLEAKKVAAKIEKRPTVLSGAMHKDIWYLPSGTSSEAQLLKDANANYLWSDSTEKGSLALNFETVFTKAQDAEIWISPSYYASLDELKNANEHYTKFKAFKTRSIYSFVNKAGESGGVLYFELGMARPDLVLKDLIKICHPELLENYETFFFKRLN